MLCGVYAIVHLPTGRRYVGSSANIPQRWRKHKAALVRGDHHSVYLQRVWNKYGAAEFSFIVVEECAVEALCATEQAHLDADFPEFNGARSANSPVLRGQKLPPEWVDKVAASVRARYASGFKIKHPPRSKEYRRRAGDTARARWDDPAYRGKTTAAIQAAMTPEEKARRTVRAKALWADPEYRARAVAARKGNAYSKGYKCTPEQRENRRRAARISNMKRNYGNTWREEYARRYPQHAGDVNA